MNFAIPEGLAPEVYPLAWLVGTWRGPGFVHYPGIDERAVLVEATFSSDGGPYLRYAATTWELTNPPASLEGEIDVAGLQPGPVWASESGYWRVPPAAEQRAGDGEGAPGQGPRTELEVLLAEPSGHVSVYLGLAQGPRIQLATDLIARTATGAEMTAAQRMYGLVNSELMWATDLAAFGHEMQSYSSGRMQRQG
ncbi:MAG TPA: FABP family protein [Candidatus Ruania gallistercoris]|uniref:Ferric nitrobindin-like protein n=1 Tax=Candidatus Ruania gallistercoris TaxID=2838746 RepID=A0A9D2EJ04_9MICO|nr:FABP family protein [Candidatus Ruania gallistercoris]